MSANKIEIDCSLANSRATIELAGKILEIIKSDYKDLMSMKVVAE